MATTDFKETGKIKFSDISDLQNNSITTGNIYASGTSATIGTSGNPFNAVYANTYCGIKFNWKMILSINPSPSRGYSFETSSYLSTYENAYCIAYFTGDSNSGRSSLFIPIKAVFTGGTTDFIISSYRGGLVQFGLNETGCWIYSVDYCGDFRIYVC